MGENGEGGRRVFRRVCLHAYTCVGIGGVGSLLLVVLYLIQEVAAPFGGDAQQGCVVGVVEFV